MRDLNAALSASAQESGVSANSSQSAETTAASETTAGTVTERHAVVMDGDDGATDNVGDDDVKPRSRKRKSLILSEESSEDDGDEFSANVSKSSNTRTRSPRKAPSGARKQVKKTAAESGTLRKAL